MTLIKTLPQSPLRSTGVVFDWDVVQREAARPVGGRLKFFSRNWSQITEDPWILDTVVGLKLKFMNTPPSHSPQTSPHFDQETSQILTNEVADLAAKGAITLVMEEGTGFISPMFLVPKSDGAWRPVINLKALN